MGLIHLVSAIVALVMGSWILLTKKGTTLHKRSGYVYVGSMAILNISAFMIYRLYGGFGIFHVAAVLSSITLLAGIVPVLRKKPKNNWIVHHFMFMYWSVIGLYAAFISEILTRIPEVPFYGMVGVGSFGVFALGYLFMNRMKKRWSVQYGLAP